MMKGVLFLLGTVATIAAGAGTYETELLRGIDIYNFRSKCWGKKNVDMYAVQMEKAKRECMQTCSPCGEQREMPARVWSMWTRMTSMSTSSRSTTTDTTSRTPWAT